MVSATLDSGRNKLDWARAHMPIMYQLARKFSKEQPFKGLTIGLAMHVEAKTGILIESLVRAGGRVVFAASDPVSTQDDVVEALIAKEGITSYAKKGLNRTQYEDALLEVLDHKPDVIVDDAAELTTRLHRCRPGMTKSVIGVTEETTTGVWRLKAMEARGVLRIPAYAVNDTPMKRYFDNVHGTGESALLNIVRLTNLLVAGKNVVIAGYGYCGRGLASKAKGLGANVIVTEVDPRRALQAITDGFRVMSMDRASELGDFFITATGNIDVVTARHFKRMKDGAVLANAGHFDVEVKVEDLKALSSSRREVREGVTEYVLPGPRRVFLLANGRLVNLSAPGAMGHPVEVMDQSFAVQFATARHLVENREKLVPKVYPVPDELDIMIARIKLESLKVEIDDLTRAQRGYFESWEGIDSKIG